MFHTELVQKLDEILHGLTLL